MSGELDIGQIPDRPATPSTSSETSNNGGNVKPRVNRDEDVADGESKPTDVDAQPGKSDSTSPKTPEAATGDAARKKGKKPAVDYVRPDVAPNQNKLSTDALDALMERMRLKNDKIREQRERVAADEDEFYSKIKEDREKQLKAREEQRAREAAARKAQANVDVERDANAKRKLENKTTREWDAEKKDRKDRAAGERGRGGPPRGGPSGRGRGRGGLHADGDSWENDPNEKKWGAMESGTKGEAPPPTSAPGTAGDAAAPEISTPATAPAEGPKVEVELDGPAAPITSKPVDENGSGKSSAPTAAEDDGGPADSTSVKEGLRDSPAARGRGQGGRRGRGGVEDSNSRGGRGGGNRGRGDRGGDRGGGRGVDRGGGRGGDRGGGRGVDRGGGRGGDRGSDRGGGRGRGRGEGVRGRGGKATAGAPSSDGPPKLPEIPTTSDEVDWANAPGDW